jgi:two-component system cell cycle sensor histidine kinase/response regulator CckA
MTPSRGAILLVEDSPTQAERVRLILEPEGYRVEVAPNGREGLERARTTLPDLIISDILMPEMDGYALCQAVKHDDTTRKIPFILFTERHAPMDIIEGLLRGADNFIPKSSSDDYLLARVRRIFQQLEHRKAGEVAIEIRVRVDGREIPISADKQQIFELLISSVEEAGRANEKLNEAQRLLQEHARQLETRVQERTRELRAAEEKYRSLVEQIPATAYVVPLERSEAGPRYVSPQVEALLGYTPSEWTSFSDFRSDLVHPDDRDQVRATLERLLAGGGPVREEYRLRARDGRWVWVRDDACVVARSGAIQGVLFDMTERRQAEAALRQSEEKHRLLFERNLAGVYRSTLDGRILECNDAFARIFGYSSRDEILSGPAVQLHPTPQARAAFLESLEKEGFLLNYGAEGKRKDGGSLRLLENASLVANVIEGTLLDVTGQTKLEEQLRQVQKMEAIGQLAGGVAHDFNNLLSVIFGSGEMVLRRMTADDARRSHIEQMLKAGEGAARLTRQLLAFSRQQVLEPTVLDVRAVVGETAKMLARVIREDIELVAVSDEDTGRVKADPGQLEQILMNLAVNARDAMPNGGRLTIEAKNADLDAAYAASHSPVRPGRYVLLAVSDTGSGMDKETQAHLFEPFFTTKEAGKGTGLGLATVYGIVKQSDGYIWVYSELGVGTTFKIYFPRVDDALQPTQEESLAPPARGSETVLLVEDETSLRDVLRDTLEENGYTVLVAGDGAAALQVADEHATPVHLMVTDVIMPGMTGREAAEEIARTRPQMKVLYVSGYTQEAIIRHGDFGVGTAFLSKPFTSTALLRKCRELLDDRESAIAGTE